MRNLGRAARDDGRESYYRQCEVGLRLPLMDTQVFAVKATRRYRVTVRTSLTLRCVKSNGDPTLPRYGTDLIDTQMREVQRRPEATA